MTLYLLRHGETEENVKNILQGHLQGELDDFGVKQNEATREKLENIHIDFIIGSDLKHCTQTTEIINKGKNLPVIFTKLLRERDWGSLTGVAIDHTKKVIIPDDAESVAQMKERALKFIDYFLINHKDNAVLTVSHGLFCRCIQAVMQGVEMSEINPMKNGEVRLINIQTK